MPLAPPRFAATAALLLAAAVNFAPVPAAAQVPAPEQGQQWALLIGVEKYAKAPPLVCTVNDVRTLAGTLRERNGVEYGKILELTDAAFPPTRAHLLEEIP